MEDVAPAIALYPNPAQHAITLSASVSGVALSEVAVFDMAGRRMPVSAVQNRSSKQHVLELDIQSLATGVYFVRWRTGNAVGSMPFQKH